MSVRSSGLAEPPSWTVRLFDRILCVIDGSENSRAAARQAARLLPARRMLRLATVVEGLETPVAPSAAGARSERRYEEARSALVEAHSACSHAQTRVLFGDSGSALVAEARDLEATLVVIGAPPRSRSGDVRLGSVGAHLLHDAPCSVLVARPAPDEAAFPRSIVVGHDGSCSAAEAALVARELAERFSADLRSVVATGGPVRAERLAADGSLEWSSLPPVEALTAASREADLLVVGSRGLPGPGSLGSVSERVAQLAHSSVLVVREPAAVVAERDAVPDDEC